MGDEEEQCGRSVEDYGKKTDKDINEDTTQMIVEKLSGFDAMMYWAVRQLIGRD